MWALNTPPASVRLFTDLPLAHFEDVYERTGNELGHTFSAFSCFFCLASFFPLPLSLTCPDPSASLHPAQRVGIFFFSSRIQFPPRSSSPIRSVLVSGSLNVYRRDRQRTCARVRPNYSALTKVRSFYSRSRLNQNEWHHFYTTHLSSPATGEIALSAWESHVIVYMLFQHIARTTF